MNQAVEVQEIIRKVVIAPGPDPYALAVSTAMGGDDPQGSRGFFLQGCDKRLPASGMVQEAMDQEQRLPSWLSPLEIADLKSTDINAVISRCPHAD